MKLSRFVTALSSALTISEEDVMKLTLTQLQDMFKHEMEITFPDSPILRHGPLMFEQKKG